MSFETQEEGIMEVKALAHPGSRGENHTKAVEVLLVNEAPREQEHPKASLFS